MNESGSVTPTTAVHPALLLLGLGQPASPEAAASPRAATDRAATEAAASPAQPAFLLLGLHQAAAPNPDPAVGVHP